MQSRAVMGAPAIYHMPNRRKSACSLVSNNINGLNGRTTNYEKYLKVGQTYKSSDDIFHATKFFAQRKSMKVWNLRSRPKSIAA